MDRSTGQNDAMTALPELLADLAAAPRLPGASCRGHAQLFDRTILRRGHQKDARQARTAALSICHDCPALDHCRAWLDRLPPDERPIGVVAGQLVSEDKTRSGFQREKAAREKRIVELHESGLAASEIAAVTGCSKTTVLRAVRGTR